MAVLEELHLMEQNNLPSVEILTSPFELGGVMSELSRNQLTESEERIRSVFADPANSRFVKTLYNEMLKWNTGVSSESIDFPSLLAIDDRDDAYYEMTENVGHKASYSYKGNNQHMIQPNLEFNFQTAESGKCLTIRTSRSFATGKQLLTRRFYYLGTDHQGNLGLDPKTELRLLALTPVEKAAAGSLATSADSLIAKGGTGEMYLCLQGLTKPSTNEDVKKWLMFITGDRGEILRGYVDMSEFKKKIIVENTVLTNKGIEELILRNLPRMLPFEKSTGTVYRMENPDSNSAVAETSVSFNTLLPRF